MLISIYLNLREAQLQCMNVASESGDYKRVLGVQFSIEDTIADLGVEPIDAYVWYRKQIKDNKNAKHRWTLEMAEFCTKYGWDWKELEKQFQEK